MKRLVLVGGGHSHVEVLRQLGVRPAAGAEITLVSPARCTSYSGMLPGLIAGHYRYHECHIDLENLARFAGARLVQSCARNINTLRRQIVLTDGATIDYDLVSINVGSTSARPALPGTADEAVAVKPVEGYAYPKSGVYAVRQGPILARNGRLALDFSGDNASRGY